MFLKHMDDHNLSPPAQLEASDSGIEMNMMMVSPKVSYSYTSLRDIMPMTVQANNASWNEIPIKNPLLKQAALAYLQPMSSPSQVPDNKAGFFHNFFNDNSCFRWLCGAVFDTLFDAFVRFFCGRRRIGNGEEQDQHHEDDDDDDEEEEDKVD